MRVKLYTYAANRPDFIRLQMNSLTKHLRDDFEYTVFNNARLPEERSRNRAVCDEMGIRCIDVEEHNRQNASYTAGYAIQWSFHNFIKHEHDVIAGIVDFDMFLINNFSVTDFLNGYHLAAVHQKREHINYLWTGLMFFDMHALPQRDTMDFTCGTIDGINVDVGGHLYDWWRNNTWLQIRTVVQTGLICAENNNLDRLPPKARRNYRDDYKVEIYAQSFLHYGRGSNWDLQSDAYHQSKTNWLNEFLSQT